MARKPLTKQGAHGTLYRYKITYKDESDPGCPVFSYSLWAYNQEHAESRFYDSEDADGWEIISISVVHESHSPKPDYKFA